MRSKITETQNLLKGVLRIIVRSLLTTKNTIETIDYIHGGLISPDLSLVYPPPQPSSKLLSPTGLRHLCMATS